MTVSTTTLLLCWSLLLSSASLQSEAFQTVNQHQQSRLSSTQLRMKNSDRAHIERNLEDAMNNDWRVFRAKLVAQEQAEAESKKNKKSKDTDTVASLTKKHEEEEKRHTQLGDMFAKTVSNIFKNTYKGSAAQKRSKSKVADIFRGDCIGGAMPTLDEDDLVYQDPFVSPSELPIFIKPKMQINKHRWAHEISHIEPGCVLIANEKLGGVFHQTVVLVIEHHETTGSTGIVINRYVCALYCTVLYCIAPVYDVHFLF